MRASNTRPQLLSSHLIKIECHPLQLNASSLEQSPRPRSLSSFAFRLSHPSFCPNTTLFAPTTSCYTTTRFPPFHSIFESYKSFSIDRMPLHESWDAMNDSLSTWIPFVLHISHTLLPISSPNERIFNKHNNYNDSRQSSTTNRWLDSI